MALTDVAPPLVSDDWLKEYLPSWDPWLLHYLPLGSDSLCGVPVPLSLAMNPDSTAQPGLDLHHGGNGWVLDVMVYLMLTRV